jgi:hypothetical protein
LLILLSIPLVQGKHGDNLVYLGSMWVHSGVIVVYFKVRHTFLPLLYLE